MSVSTDSAVVVGCAGDKSKVDHWRTVTCCSR